METGPLKTAPANTPAARSWTDKVFTVVERVSELINAVSLILPGRAGTTESELLVTLQVTSFLAKLEMMLDMVALSLMSGSSR